MININRYKDILRNTSLFKLPKLQTHTPEVADSDYKIGYITRYFIQKSNDISSPIFEVNRDRYPTYMDSPFYVTTSLQWRISGEDDAIKQSNLKSIKIASTHIKNLKVYLPNLLQFKKQ